MKVIGFLATLALGLVITVLCLQSHQDGLATLVGAFTVLLLGLQALGRRH